MNAIIRKAELTDATSIFKAEQEIAQEPSFSPFVWAIIHGEKACTK